MKQFLLFVGTVFLGLFLWIQMKSYRETPKSSEKILRVFAASSFTSQWGPGPWLQNEFEKTCGCRIEFFDGADSTLLLQRLKSEGRAGADVVLGFDQYDLDQARAQLNWKSLNFAEFPFVSEIGNQPAQLDFVPYNWGLISFVGRSSQVAQAPNRFEDLLQASWKNQIALQDPRTSSPGLQFLMWLVRTLGEDQAFQFLKKLNGQIQSYSTSWSMSYGLFSKSQVLTVLSYTTSPLFHRIEEKSKDVVAWPFVEGHPLQIEYAAIPENCQQCDLANQFVQFLLSSEGQKIVMEKNFMFPARQGVREGSLFQDVPPVKILPLFVPSLSERERLLKKWSLVRRAD